MKDCSWVSPDFILDPHNTQSCHSASYQFTLPQHTMPQLKPVLTSSDIGLLAVTVSQSQLFTTSSLTQCWPVERFRAHVEICLPQLSLIFHTSVWRIGGVDLWPTTENTRSYVGLRFQTEDIVAFFRPWCNGLCLCKKCSYWENNKSLCYSFQCGCILLFINITAYSFIIEFKWCVLL